ncbi:hypothetical protein L1887_61695 [Cichorium endivia]|nr:hypothetical protein L1887_61695 [Cichorium endivia]
MQPGCLPRAVLSTRYRRVSILLRQRMGRDEKTYAAIDAHVTSRHEAASFAGEEDSGALELARLADAVHGVIVGPLLEQMRLLGEQLFDHLRVDVSGADGVDADSVFGQLNGGATTQLMHCRLGRVVRRSEESAVGNVAGHGGNQDDASARGMVLHRASCGLRDDECACDVDAKDPVKVSWVKVKHGALLLDSGGVDDRGEGSGGIGGELGDLGDDLVDRGRVGDIGLHVGCAELELFGARLEHEPVSCRGRLVEQIHAYDVRTSLEQRSSQRQPNPTSTSRH